jgi:phosphatidylglycerophosphatase C
MKSIAFFDFDKTLYKKDSLIEFTKYYFGFAKFYFGLFFLLPDIIKFKTGLISNESLKIKYITHFFKNENYNDFKWKAAMFATSKIEQHLNLYYFEKFKVHIQSNDVVYIVTASFPEWIEPWSTRHNVKVIGTQLQKKYDILTGTFNSKNCYGIEKVNRINETVNLDEYDRIYVYGKGKGDKEMLSLIK